MVATKPANVEIAFSGVFREIDPPCRLQRTEVFEAIPGAESLVTFTFDEKDDQQTGPRRVSDLGDGTGCEGVLPEDR